MTHRTAKELAIGLIAVAAFAFAAIVAIVGFAVLLAYGARFLGVI